MTYTLPTLRSGYYFQIDIDSDTGKSFLSVYLDGESEPHYRPVSYALPFMPDSYELAIASTAATIERCYPRLFVDSPDTEKSRYQHALNTLLEENDQ